MNRIRITLCLMLFFLVVLGWTHVDTPSPDVMEEKRDSSMYRTVIRTMVKKKTAPEGAIRGVDPRLLRPNPRVTGVSKEAFAPVDSNTVVSHRVVLNQMGLRAADALRDERCQGSVGSPPPASSEEKRDHSVSPYCRELLPFWTIVLSRMRPAGKTCPIQTGTPVDSTILAKGKQRSVDEATHFVRVLEMTGSSWGVFDVALARKRTPRTEWRTAAVVECYTVYTNATTPATPTRYATASEANLARKGGQRREQR